jgi:hypothetical protein
MALGVPARVVQDLNEVHVGVADFSATVNTLPEAMTFGRHLDRKEELELARLASSLHALQQQKKALQQQNGNVARQSDRLPEARQESGPRGRPGALLYPLSGPALAHTIITTLVGCVFVLGIMFGLLLDSRRYTFGIGAPQSPLV